MFHDHAQTKFIYILTRGILTMAGIPKQDDKKYNKCPLQAFMLCLWPHTSGHTVKLLFFGTD
jgi:hypothetical protein